MKIALVVPTTKSTFNNYCAPLNLGYIASYLRANVQGVEVKIFDGTIHRNIEELLFEFQPGIVGVTAVTPQAPEAYRLLDAIRANRPDIYTIMGGVHCSALPNEALLHADAVVKGEGEKTFANIVQSYIETKQKQTGACFEGEYAKILDDLPSPAYDLISMEEYLKRSSYQNLVNPMVSMVTSRGCAYNCVFCRNSSRNIPVRYFSAQRIVDEILFFRKKYGVNSVFFADDEFLINKTRLQELSILFSQEGITDWLTWGCQARTKTIADETLLTVAKSMGCVSVMAGFESGCSRILAYLKCGSTTIQDSENAVKTASKMGLPIGGSFVFGLPTETLKEMKQTTDWIENHKELKYISVNTIVPYPGTVIWKQIIERSLLPKNVNYEKLVQTFEPKETYIINHVIKSKDFNKFIVGTRRMVWVMMQMRQDPSLKTFFKLAHYKTFWWCWLHHPRKMIKIMRIK